VEGASRSSAAVVAPTNVRMSSPVFDRSGVAVRPEQQDGARWASAALVAEAARWVELINVSPTRNVARRQARDPSPRATAPRRTHGAICLDAWPSSNQAAHRRTIAQATLAERLAALAPGKERRDRNLREQPGGGCKAGSREMPGVHWLWSRPTSWFNPRPAGLRGGAKPLKVLKGKCGQRPARCRQQRGAFPGIQPMVSNQGFLELGAGCCSRPLG